MIIITSIILIAIFLSNFFLYWLIFLKTERKISNWWDIYTQINVIIWIAAILLIPIITSSYLSQLFNSDLYYKFPNFSLQIIFFILGITLVIISLIIYFLTHKVNKKKGLAKGRFHLITGGVYKVMRHPMNTSWAIFFLGLALLCESLIGLIISPFFILILGLDGYLEEKYILLPLFKENYVNYSQKTPNRLFPTPYNMLLIIIYIFIIYVGFLGFFVKYN